MKTTLFEPWSFTDLLHRDLNRVARHRFDGNNARTPDTHWTPAVDIVAEEQRFLLRADVPGVDAGAIDVAMDDGVLTISGARPADVKSDDSDAQRIERASGPFLRRFKLPETADAENITAKTQNGILEVVIPKLPEVQPRRITVEAA